MIAEIVYLLCMATSLLCTVLLLRSYRRTGVSLLFWSGLCFLGLFLNNALVFVDLIVLPQGDFSVVRVVPAALGLAVLCYGLVREATP
ncbi:MAG TPA: DUF5985 family protein [Candidatus Baltobacteraceae bacterium]|jgi:hypothetical protein